MLAYTTAPERAARATRRPLGTRTRIICARKRAFEADWGLRRAPTCARLERIELLIGRAR
jgi:hypothetical protein